MKEYLPALTYPLRNHGFVTSIIAIILLWCSFLFPFALIIGQVAELILYGYIFCFFMKMVQTSSNGEDAICDFPLFEGFSESILLPFFRITILTLICFFPGALSSRLEWDESTTWILLIAGHLYFPLAFMRMSIMESITAISPVQIFRTFLKIPIPCLLLILFTTIVIGLSSLSAQTNTLISFVLVPLNFYLFSVLMNIMGRFFRNYEDAFDF